MGIILILLPQDTKAPLEFTTKVLISLFGHAQKQVGMRRGVFEIEAWWTTISTMAFMFCLFIIHDYFNLYYSIQIGHQTMKKYYKRYK